MKTKANQIKELMRVLPCLDFENRKTLMPHEVVRATNLSKGHILKLYTKDKLPVLRLGRDSSESAVRLSIDDYQVWVGEKLVLGSGLTLEQLLEHPLLQDDYPEIPACLMPTLSERCAPVSKADKTVTAWSFREVSLACGLSPSYLNLLVDSGDLPVMEMTLSERSWKRLPHWVYVRFIAAGIARGEKFISDPKRFEKKTKTEPEDVLTPWLFEELKPAATTVPLAAHS